MTDPSPRTPKQPIMVTVSQIERVLEPDTDVVLYEQAVLVGGACVLLIHEGRYILAQMDATTLSIMYTDADQAAQRITVERTPKEG